MKKILSLAAILILAPLGCGPKPAALEGEGYKGIPWGTPYQTVLELKHPNVVSEANHEVGYFGSKDTGWWDIYFNHRKLEDQLMDYSKGGQLVEGLFQGFKVRQFDTSDDAMNFDLFTLPESFRSIYVEDDDTVYCFYKEKYFAALTVIPDDSWDKVKGELKAKYGEGSPFQESYGLRGWEDSGKNGINSGSVFQFNGRNYSKGKKTDIYLVKIGESLFEGEDFSYTDNLIYLCRDYVPKIHADFFKALADQKAQDAKDAKEDAGRSFTPSSGDAGNDENLKKVE